MSKLYVIPTPVGNMEDITYRAVRLLKEVDLILAEDTRTSAYLLKHLEIEKPMMSHHKFNEHGTSANIANRIKAGENIALISDAGTPGISDPGFFLVRKCIEEGVEVETLPGATAFIPALINSGFPCDRFCFEGFLPQKKGRNKRMEALINEPRTIIFYESPYRVTKLITQIGEILGAEREISVSREISKKFEETVRGNAKELTEHFQSKAPKGEFVVVVKGCQEKE